MTKHFFLTDNRTGCRFITVDAYREAQKFYEKNGFIPLQHPDDDKKKTSRTIPMFFDLLNIAQK